ncbi:hypothetical protein [Nocardia suismassiliense]|uniref:hypothetical protein n=1 Tax=Nocardia suismassiliense TaxID=2077092 RepID=UPI00131F03C1|nr:hypothetical protein [Nocardia suismassiliense]
MIVETIPMWTDQQTLVHLRDVLELFPANNWRWKLDDCDGVGRFPAGVTWAEFQVAVEAGAAVFDWVGIQQFADGLDQMIDGRIVATDANDTVVVTIDVLDSTEYKIVIDPVRSDTAASASAVALFELSPAASASNTTTA